MKISLLVPYRSDDGGARDINWEWLQKYWATELPEAEVVTGDDGSIPFNRAASINVAARKAYGDIFVNMDADYWCHPSAIRRQPASSAATTGYGGCPTAGCAD